MVSNSIRLYTQSGWEYIAQKQGDPHFSSFFAGMEEACGELPNELLLEGSVGEIVQEEWDEYMRMYEVYVVVDTIRKTYARLGQPTHHHANITKLVCEYSDESVLASDVIRIMQILNSIPNWQVYTLAGGLMHSSEVVKHLIAVGDILQSEGVTMSDMLRAGHTRGIDQTNVYSVHTDVIHMLSNLTDNEDTTVIKIILALLHDAYLKTAYHSNRFFSLFGIGWEYVDDILRELGYNENHTTEDEVKLRSTASLLSHRGSVENVDPHLFGVLIARKNEGIIETNLTLGVDILQLYDAIWACLPTDVDPYSIGLTSSLLLDVQASPPRNACLELLYHVHTMPMCLLNSVRSSTLNRAFSVVSSTPIVPLYVAALGQSIAGTQGLGCISQCLRAYMKNATLSMEVRTRLYNFCVYADRYAKSRYGKMNNRNTSIDTEDVEAIAKIAMAI